MQVKITFDTKNLVRSLEKLQTQAPREMANALNKVAASARTAFNAATVEELGLRSGRQLKFSISKELSRASPDKLKATFKPSGRTINMIEVVSKRQPLKTNQYKRGNLHVNTHNGKDFPHGFIVIGKSGRASAMDRTPSNTGKNPHSLRTTAPRTLMAQENSKPRRVWEETASNELGPALVTALDTAIKKSGF